MLQILRLFQSKYTGGNKMTTTKEKRKELEVQLADLEDRDKCLVCDKLLKQHTLERVGKRRLIRTINSMPIGAQETIARALAGKESYLVRVCSCGCKYLSRDYGFTYRKESCAKHANRS